MDTTVGLMGDGDSSDEKRDRDESSGRYVEKYPREVIRESIADLGGMAATSEVADALDAQRNTIYKKLSLMADDGELTSRMAGGIRVWSIAEESDG